LACPFFMPTRRMDGLWAHPLRLPLGNGWQGHCTAPGHEGAIPEDEQLRQGCNLGYAANCPRLPQERVADAVRFSIARDDDHEVVVLYACEIAHRPGEHGRLEYLVGRRTWLQPHPDTRIQKMAECFVESYFQKTRHTSEAAESGSSHG
jgi:hypothetical protein